MIVALVDGDNIIDQDEHCRAKEAAFGLVKAPKLDWPAALLVSYSASRVRVLSPGKHPRHRREHSIEKKSQ